MKQELCLGQADPGFKLEAHLYPWNIWSNWIIAEWTLFNTLSWWNEEWSFTLLDHNLLWRDIIWISSKLFNIDYFFRTVDIIYIVHIYGRSSDGLAQPLVWYFRFTAVRYPRNAHFTTEWHMHWKMSGNFWLSLSVLVLTPCRFYSLGRTEHVPERPELISDRLIKPVDHWIRSKHSDLLSESAPSTLIRSLTLTWSITNCLLGSCNSDSLSKRIQ